MEETKTLIKSSTKQIEVVIHELDVADDAAVLRVAKAVIDKHGCPDILVNNAGQSLNPILSGILLNNAG